MNKLKTLREIPNNVEKDWCYLGELRKEAKNWIEVIREKIEFLYKLESKTQSILQKVATRGLDDVLKGQIKIFEDFFDLEEEITK